MMLESRVKGMINENTSLASVIQGWTKKAEQINYPALLPEDQATPLLTKMLVPAPYQASEKKAKKKGQEARNGLRRKGASDIVSEDTESSSSHDDNVEEEERNSPPKGRKKKRAAFADLEVEATKKGKPSLSDDSEVDADAIPKRRPRPKPLAESSAAKLAAASHAAEVSELKRRLEAKQVDTSEVEALKSALAKAKKEADEERTARQKHEARLDKVQQELTDAIRKCESLERGVSERDSELATALQSAKEARVEAQGACQEI
nr:transcriptional regulator ATRX homolog [Aegilops tauschii subsp. strangulata]